MAGKYETRRNASELSKNVEVLLFCEVLLFPVSDLCFIFSQANRTCEIIYKSNAIYDDPEFKDEINLFALQIMQNPLSFTPAGFFTLDKKFVRSVRHGDILTFLQLSL